MSKNICMFCKDETKETTCLVINSGSVWIDFCSDCGKTETLENAETRERQTIQSIADSGKKEQILELK